MFDFARLEWLQPMWLWMLPLPLVLMLWWRQSQGVLKVSDTTGWDRGPISWKVRLQVLVPILYLMGLMSLMGLVRPTLEEAAAGFPDSHI